jgi:hypothetical protein
LLVVAGAAWGFAAGASRPQGANAAVSALASPLLAPLLLPPAAMLASLIGIFDDGARPIPFGLAVAACLVAGGAMSALALASASFGALAFGGGAYSRFDWSSDPDRTTVSFSPLPRLRGQPGCGRRWALERTG